MNPSLPESLLLFESTSIMLLRCHLTHLPIWCLWHHIYQRTPEPNHNQSLIFRCLRSWEIDSVWNSDSWKHRNQWPMYVRVLEKRWLLGHVLLWHWETVLAGDWGLRWREVHLPCTQLSILDEGARCSGWQAALILTNHRPIFTTASRYHKSIISLSLRSLVVHPMVTW